ncbi:7833_t:CDS:2, partial [Funneliformis geosporum]
LKTTLFWKSQQSSSSSKGSSSSTSGKISEKQAQSFKYGNFKYISILSVKENKKVLECEFHEKPIVLKCIDLSKKPNCLDELLNEVETYKVLAKLQGVYILKLLFYGDLANGMNFVIGLNKIHDYKILHNDICEKNILVDEKGYMYLTDFEMSIRNDDKELFSKEKCELSYLLDCYM